MSTATIGRWGKSLAVRLPSEIASRLALAEGATVEVEQRDDEIVIRKTKPPLTIAEMFKGKSPEEWRAIYREHGVDWGPDVGREIVDE
jgi:antitoxin MazE